MAARSIALLLLTASLLVQFINCEPASQSANSHAAAPESAQTKQQLPVLQALLTATSAAANGGAFINVPAVTTTVVPGSSCLWENEYYVTGTWAFCPTCQDFSYCYCCNGQWTNCGNTQSWTVGCQNNLGVYHDWHSDRIMIVNRPSDPLWRPDHDHDHHDHDHYDDHVSDHDHDHHDDHMSDHDHDHHDVSPHHDDSPSHVDHHDVTHTPINNNGMISHHEQPISNPNIGLGGWGGFGGSSSDHTGSSHSFGGSTPNFGGSSSSFGGSSHSFGGSGMSSHSFGGGGFGGGGFGGGGGHSFGGGGGGFGGGHHGRKLLRFRA